jgi:hypothetical protein
MDPAQHLPGRSNLIDLGATALVFMPIGFATENHETLLDVEHIIEALRRKHPEVTYVQMPCVNDHPEFLQMAATWTDKHIANLLEAEALAVNPSLAVETGFLYRRSRVCSICLLRRTSCEVLASAWRRALAARC